MMRLPSIIDVLADVFEFTNLYRSHTCASCTNPIVAARVDNVLHITLQTIKELPMTTHNERPHHAAIHAAIDSRSAGIAILLAAIISIVFVALDSGATGTDPLSVMQSMVRVQQMHRIVHIVAMACIGAFMYGYSTMSQQLGLHRAPVKIGLISYGLGSVLMLFATVIDGFISTDTAVMFVSKSPEAVKAGYWMIQAMENVALIDIARVSWVFQSVAVIAWSVALLADGGFRRKIGVVGLAAGGLPAVAVFVVGSNMTDAVVVGILLLQAIWNVASALLLRDGRSTPAYVAQQAVPAY
jgi:hypothetical protein